MKTVIKLTIVLLLGAFTAHAQHAKYVVMISIDGFRPEFYKDAEWGALNLREIAAQGMYADGVRGVVPTVTYPSHTLSLLANCRRSTAYITTRHLKPQHR